MGRPRHIDIWLTEEQYEALAECVALHSAEDDDYPDDPRRRGIERARENAWLKIRTEWHK